LGSLKGPVLFPSSDWRTIEGRGRFPKETGKGERFDIILANLYGEVLVSLVSDLAKCLQPGGLLVLSGIHYDFNYELRTAFIKTGLDLMRDRFLENYTTMVFRKEP